MWWWGLLACGIGGSGADMVRPAVPRGVCAVQPLPDDLVPLTSDNVEQVRRVGTLCDGTDRGAIESLAWADGQLASSGERLGVQLWDVGQAAVRSMTVGEPVRAIAWIEGVASLPDEHMLALATEGGEVFGVDFAGHRVWQADGRHDGAATAMFFRPEAGDAFSVGEDGFVFRWSLADGHLLAQQEVGGALTAIVQLGEELVVAGDGLITQSLAPDSLAMGRPWAKEREVTHTLAVRPVADHLAVGSSRLVVWEGGMETRFDRPIEGSVRALDYDPYGDLLAVGTWGGQLLVIDTATRLLAASREPFDEQTKAVHFGPGGRWIAAAGDGGIIHLYGVRRSELR